MASASLGNVVVEIDENALQNAINEADGILAALKSRADEIASTANGFGAAFETERTVDWATGEHFGGTQPVYGSDVKIGARGPVGIVVPKNYAALKDNYLHNTLLKAKG